jgi:hypothetical protein
MVLGFDFDCGDAAVEIGRWLVFGRLKVGCFGLDSGGWVSGLKGLIR